MTAGFVVEESGRGNANAQVQQVYSGVGTIRVREDEPPELIRDYNRTNPPPPAGERCWRSFKV